MKITCNTVKPMNVRSRLLRSAPQEVCIKIRSRFRAFVHLSFKCFMCGMKDSLRSKTTPRNLVSSKTGTGVPFSSRVGSGWGLRNLRLLVQCKVYQTDVRSA